MMHKKMHQLTIKRMFKRILPLCGVALIGAVFITVSKKPNTNVPTQSALLNYVSALQYKGESTKGQHFHIQSNHGTEISKNEVALEHIQGTMDTKKGETIAMNATQGIFDKEAQSMQLSGNVTLAHENGLKIFTNSATFDFNTNGAHGETPINGEHNGAKIKANSFKVNNGTEIVLMGDPQLVLPSHG